MDNLIIFTRKTKINYMLNIIETYIKKKFKTWRAYEIVAGIPARHGKRRMLLYIERLEKMLKPLGLTIKVVKEKKK